MTRRTLTLTVTLALTAALAAACGDDGGDDPPTATGDERPDSGTLVDGDGYRGVLLDAHLDDLQPVEGPSLEGDEVASFVPTEDEVAQFEAQLPAALPEANNPNLEEVAPEDLPDYVRQYTGVAGGGQEQLVVAGFCDEEMDWQDGWIQVADGGTCFWDATMDLGTGEILRFAFNGSA